MFKRLFFLSGIIAFLLALAVTWFWYLPRQETMKSSQVEVESESDTTSSEVVEMEFQ